MRTTQWWARTPDGRWRSFECHVPIWVSASGSVPASIDATERPGPDRVLVTQVEPRGSLCATLLRPDDATADVRINGVRAEAGLHLVHHGDLLSVDGRELCFAVRTSHDEARYDPTRHGEQAYCTRTKSRLRPGDPIVVCAGTPQAACGLPYTAAAWAAGIPCHGCGATVEEEGWVPPDTRSSGPVDELLRLVRSMTPDVP